MPKAKSSNAGKGKARGQRKAQRSPSPPSDCLAIIGNQTTKEQYIIQVTDKETLSKSGKIPKGTNTPSDLSMSKPKQLFCLRDEQEEGHVLQWIAENPCLWDFKNKYYKTNAVKERLWEVKADELQYDAVSLKNWYTGLWDWNIRLHAKLYGDGQREFTDRERWVMDQFMFLRTTNRQLKAPVMSAKEASVLAQGELEEAERVSADGKFAITVAEENASTEGQSVTMSEPNLGDPILVEFQKKFADTKAELLSVRNSLAAAEPATERTAFLDWVREVCEMASYDQFVEFKTKFLHMQNIWKQQQCSAKKSLSSAREFDSFQPVPTQWTMPPQHLQITSPCQGQSPEYMQTYRQQPFIYNPSNLSDFSQVISSALFNLDDADSL